MPIKEREDHFTIAQVAKDLRLDIEQVEQLITKGALRMAVPSAEVEEISSLSDPLQSTAWYGRADPLDHFADATGLNLPQQDRQDCDLSPPAWGMENAKNVETSLLADLPKYLYLKLAPPNQSDDVTDADSGSNLSFRSDEFEIFSGEKVRIVFVEDINLLGWADEPDYRRRVLSINISEPVISREEKERFKAEYYVEEKQLTEPEKENLLKLIGVLAHSYANLAKKHGAAKFMKGDAVNFRQVAEQMDYELDHMGVEDKQGIGIETNQRKISAGLKLLESFKGHKSK